MFTGNGNFLSNFCGPIFDDLCEYNVNVWLPNAPEDGESFKNPSCLMNEEELYNLIDFSSDKTSTKYDPVTKPLIGTESDW